MWSDHEEELYQQGRRRGAVMRVTMIAFVGLAIAAVVDRGWTSVVLFALAFVALGLTAVLGGVWGLNRSVALSFGQPARARKADRRHMVARRATAIRDGTWTPPGPD